ncbi:uncharacterized protein F5147DRAFT_658243 [Suillus discolor]|uniref:Uncharacterized protein n=1 Tax=Suillus discolor TaxID=1912936 RepID=A0A9P7JMT9_9AGAM|nr:uncharacterized protein F5147DRAFT_658243 [Suillus discolor]KAG2090108.1 hypothetical protein F5147DRAFT_658243 [Suillus discolor]
MNSVGENEHDRDAVYQVTGMPPERMTGMVKDSVFNQGTLVDYRNQVAGNGYWHCRRAPDGKDHVLTQQDDSVSEESLEIFHKVNGCFATLIGLNRVAVLPYFPLNEMCQICLAADTLRLILLLLLLILASPALSVQNNASYGVDRMLGSGEVFGNFKHHEASCSIMVISHSDYPSHLPRTICKIRDEQNGTRHLTLNIHMIARSVSQSRDRCFLNITRDPSSSVLTLNVKATSHFFICLESALDQSGFLCGDVNGISVG